MSKLYRAMVEFRVEDGITPPKPGAWVSVAWPHESDDLDCADGKFLSVTGVDELVAEDAVTQKPVLKL